MAVFMTLITLVGFSRPALADVGPDGTYYVHGTAIPTGQIWYTLSNSDNVTATNVEIPIYSATIPAGTTNIGLAYSPGNGGIIQFRAGTNTVGNNPVTFGIPRGTVTGGGTTVWQFDAQSNLYKALVYGSLTSAYGTYMPFRISTGAGFTVGYSSGNNSDFAVGNTSRCANSFSNDNPSGDQSGCNLGARITDPRQNWGKYYDYDLPFAPACNVRPIAGRPVAIVLYDPDNPSGNDRTGSQPAPYTTVLMDDTTGTAVSYTTSIVDGSPSDPTAGQSRPPVASDNKATETLSFDFVAGHKYTLHINNVYVNNVLQFQLPFDSIYHAVTCAAPTYQNALTLSAPANANANDEIILQANARNLNGVSPSITVIGKTVEAGGTSYFSFVRNNNPGLPNYSAASKTITWPPHSFDAAGDSGPYSYTLVSAPNTPTGRYCFTASMSPANQTGASVTSLPACVQIKNVNHPTLIGNNGDIQAGGGVCGGTQTGGNITGNDYAMGQYVLSAAGTINNFGSNNNFGDKSASLGAYGNVCRPDLWTQWTDYKAGGGAYTTVGGGLSASALSSLAGAGQTVLYAPGNLTIGAGTISKTFTLVVGGDLTINGSVVRSGSALGATAQAELGVIVNGNIGIQGTATQVDALLVSNGTINTCSTAGATCKNALVVNGLLMAHYLRFDRLGVGNVATGQIVNAETINLSPALYFDPPPLFAGGDNESLLQDEGERPPLY